MSLSLLNCFSGEEDPIEVMRLTIFRSFPDTHGRSGYDLKRTLEIYFGSRGVGGSNPLTPTISDKVDFIEDSPGRTRLTQVRSSPVRSGVSPKSCRPRFSNGCSWPRARPPSGSR